ncbi:MAG: hypothetical protein JWM91_359, partial [Rhodospirillales bacterium]|nr:hypothetical protein [Rhodospirillales bacterium]
STGAAGGAFDTLLARAGSDRHPVPFRGYPFPILTRQRKHSRTERRAISSAAKCPAASRCRLSRGIPLVGVMTFMVGDDDVVYEKDSVSDVTNLATAMTAYNPGPGWKPVEYK